MIVNQYQQNEHPPLISTHWKYKKTTISDVGNSH